MALAEERGVVGPLPVVDSRGGKMIFKLKKKSNLKLLSQIKGKYINNNDFFVISQFLSGMAILVTRPLSGAKRWRGRGGGKLCGRPRQRRLRGSKVGNVINTLNKNRMILCPQQYLKISKKKKVTWSSINVIFSLKKKFVMSVNCGQKSYLRHWTPSPPATPLRRKEAAENPSMGKNDRKQLYTGCQKVVACWKVTLASVSLLATDHVYLCG